MPLSRDEFAKAVIATGVLTTAEMHALWAALPEGNRPRTAEQLAGELVRQERLTAYQAEQICRGEGRSLVMGNYLVLEVLGQGGMGMVFKAEHRRMKRVVALKVLAPHVTKSPEALKRFQREVEAAARLTHPNIVIAHDADEAGGNHFLVMEYVPGIDLAGWVKTRGPLPLAEAVALVIQAARGLDYAHRQGIVHRDIKPGNLLLDSHGTVKILDMGLARLHSAGPQQDELTGSGQVMGTVDYMAPEQAMNTKQADARADIYALGATLWYLVSGRALFDGETMVEKLMAHQTRAVPPLAEACAQASPELQRVFARMVAKSPNDRYQTMSEVISDLQRCCPADPAELTVSLDGPTARMPGEMSASRGGIPPVAGSAVSVAGRVPPVVRAPQPTTAKSAFEITLDVGQRQIDTDPKSEQSLPPAFVESVRQMAARPSAARHWWRNRTVAIAGAACGLGLVVLAAWLVWPPPSGPVIAKNEPSRPPEQRPIPPANTPPAKAGPEQGLRGTAGSPPSQFALEFTGQNVVECPTLLLNARADYTLEGFVAEPQRSPGGRGGMAFGFPETSFLSFSKSDNWRWQAVHVPNSRTPLARIPAVAARTHMACVRQGNEHRLYVNGKLAGKDVFETPDESNNAFEIGREFVGLVDEVRVSSVARYAVDFVPWPRFEPDEHTLALYHLDEGSGTAVRDASGHGHHGTIGDPRWRPLAADILVAERGKAGATNSLGMEFVAVPAGTGWLGGGGGMPGREPVEFSRGFEIGKYEVTQAQWRNLMGSVPGEFTPQGTEAAQVAALSEGERDRLPANGVSWEMAEAFVQQVNARVASEGWRYRLPSAREWEYACRGGPAARAEEHGFDFYSSLPANVLDAAQANFNKSLASPAPVGSYPANSLGLFDMHGNVAEWCADVVDDNGDSLRYLRGGSWTDPADLCRASRRGLGSPTAAYSAAGLRLVRERAP